MPDDDSGGDALIIRLSTSFVLFISRKCPLWQKNDGRPENACFLTFLNTADKRKLGFCFGLSILGNAVRSSETKEHCLMDNLPRSRIFDQQDRQELTRTFRNLDWIAFWYCDEWGEPLWWVQTSGASGQLMLGTNA